MRRDELVDSVENVLKTIHESKLYDTVKATFRGLDSKKEMTPLIESLQRFSIFSSRFNENEMHVLEIFRLKEVNDPKTWASIFSATEKTTTRDAIYGIYHGLDNLINYLPKILELLKRDYEKKEKKGEKGFSGNVIRVILPEKETISRPERLQNILESITNFYEVFSIIHNKNQADLGVIGLDSGSDKSFDFVGAAKVMESIRKLIIDLWDRIVFYRERKISEKFELIAKSLPIIDEIGRLEKDGKLGKEQCEIMRRQIVNGAMKFVSAGALLPEFNLHATQDPRALMTPEPKLLSANEKKVDRELHNEEEGILINQDIQDEGIAPEVDDDFTDEEQEKISKFLRNLNKGKKKRNS